MNGKPKVLVRPEDVKPTLPNFRMRGVFNPAGIRLKDGRIMLYARIAETPKHGETVFLAPRFSGTKKMEITIDKIMRKKMEFDDKWYITNEKIARLPTISHMRKILLDESGMYVEEISDKPDFYGLKDDGDFGVEDPRITFFEKEKRYAMTYVAISMKSGVSTFLALSKDLKNWERKGILFAQQNKDVAIFPEKINGYYVALNRPEGTMIFDKPRIWISYSKDLIFWGKDKPIIMPRPHSWDSLRIGTGTVPLKTKKGWLVFYHGVKEVNGPKPRKVYCAGAFLLDLKRPDKVLARTPVEVPLLRPELPSEKEGFINEVVFPTAAIPDKDGKSILIYSGAADSSTTVRKMSINKIINSLEKVSQADYC